jgi:hypothetical protein
VSRSRVHLVREVRLGLWDRKDNRGPRVLLDQKGDAGPPGPAGPAGQKGEPGAPRNQLRVVTGETTVSCDEGETLVSVVCSLGAPNGVTCPDATETKGLCLRK